MSNSSIIEKENKILEHNKPTSSISDRSLKSEKENIDVEKAYKSRLNRINILKQQKIKNNTSSNIENSLNEINIIKYSIFKTNLWEYVYFYIEYFPNNQKLPHLISTNKWDSFEIFENYSKESIVTSGIEMKNIMIKSIFNIDYFKFGIEIEFNLQIKGEGSFWLFTRLNPNDSLIYNKNSTIIEISKLKNSNKAFISFGTFIDNTQSNFSSIVQSSRSYNGNIDKKYNKNYQVFMKRQLIDYNVDNKNNYCIYYGEDTINFNCKLYDFGSEIIKGKIKLNNSKKENEVFAKFYLPLNEKNSIKKIMFGGGGDNVKLIQFKCNTLNSQEIVNFEKDEFFIIGEENKNCQCCYIY